MSCLVRLIYWNLRQIGKKYLVCTVHFSLQMQRPNTLNVLLLPYRAAAVEEELRGIAERQEVNVNKLVELVKENGEILAKMRVREYTIVLFYLYVYCTLYISNMIHIILLTKSG